jgi:hypothetical protein
MTRYSLGRILGVSLGLAAAGAVFGAIAGAVALATGLVLSGDYAHLDEPVLFAIAATVGAMLGQCAPPSQDGCCFAECRWDALSVASPLVRHSGV